MKIVIALGGNALLKRGQPMTYENQHANIVEAAERICSLLPEHELVITHGNGPQVGLLALQAAAYTQVAPYPLDVLGAQTEAMIGYTIEQEIRNRADVGRHVATLLTLVKVDPKDPAFENPTKPIGPVYNEAAAKELAAEKGWSIAPDGDMFRPLSRQARTPLTSLFGSRDYRGVPRVSSRPFSSRIWRSTAAFSSAPTITTIAAIHSHIIRPITAPSEP